MAGSTAGPRNRLNDLTNREWIRETKSFWWSEAAPDGVWTAADVAALQEWLAEQKGPEAAEAMLAQALASHMLSVAPPRGEAKSRHPATFSERDVERLIRFFTKAGQTVLDPFVGSGSTLVACRDCGRLGLGIELIPQWADIARERCGGDDGQVVVTGDALAELRKMAPQTVDFVVTSPPYWSILRKEGMKVAAERDARGLPTRYSDEADDLGNIMDYGEFLDRLAEVFGECRRVLRPGGYMAVVVSDFRHGPQFVLFHADLAQRIETVGLPLRGVTVLLQDNKNLYPFGLGNAFVSNIHHQYILIHQRPREAARKESPDA